jgi:lysine-specific demethylase 8
MPVQKIDRIPLPDADTFFKQYVVRRRPVIITDLFQDQPIRSITSFADARVAFGKVVLNLRTEYTTAMSGPQQSMNLTMTCNDYWDFVEANPSTPVMCTEYEIPSRVMALFELPSICLNRDADDSEILSMPRKYGDHDLNLKLFVGNRGNKAHLHFDGDHRQVLLYQVFGTKDVVLFQPESTGALRPLDLVPWFAGVCLESMSERERLDLLESGNGYSATLYPGEAIYMPMLMWHYLEYTDNAMSFNMRFGRNRYGRFLCVDNFHRDYYIQNVASRFGELTRCESEYRECLDTIIAEFQRPASLTDKVKSMRTLFRELCQRICPEAQADEFCPPEREEAEVEKILEDSKGTFRYADAPSVLRMRQSGPISTAQRNHIESGAKLNGYSPKLLRHLLGNRLGKPDINSLTKAEAAQFISYMALPGARWA